MMALESGKFVSGGAKATAQVMPLPGAVGKAFKSVVGWEGFGGTPTKLPPNATVNTRVVVPAELLTVVEVRVTVTGLFGSTATMLASLFNSFWISAAGVALLKMRLPVVLPL